MAPEYFAFIHGNLRAEKMRARSPLRPNYAIWQLILCKQGSRKCLGFVEYANHASFYVSL